MSAKEIAEEALRLAEGATPGPWRFEIDESPGSDDCGAFMPGTSANPDESVMHFGNDNNYYPTEGRAPDPEDRALIEHASEHYATLARACLEMVSDLPHALKTCGCRPRMNAHTRRVVLPAAHTAAIERLRALGGS